MNQIGIPWFFLPQFTDNHGEQTQCAARLLEVGDSGGFMVQRYQQFGMERIIRDDFLSILGSGGALGEVNILQHQALKIFRVGIGDFLSGVGINLLEEAMSDDGSDFRFTCGRDNVFLPGGNTFRLSQ